MARMSPVELLGRLEKGKPIPAILLLGEEPYLRDACRKQLIERFVAEASRTWAVSRYSAGRGETQAALDQAQTMAMLSPQQVVFLEDTEAIEKLGEKNRDEAVAQLGAYLENPAPFTVLVVEATGLDQRMKLGKLLAEKTLVVECGLGEKVEERLASATTLAKAIAKEEGVEFEKGAAEDLAEFVDRLLRDGEAPLEMLGAITWMYRKVMEASELKGVTNGWQAARSLSMRPEQAEQAVQSARKISKARLLGGLRALQRADDRLKGGKDARTVLEFLVSELTAPDAQAARG